MTLLLRLDPKQAREIAMTQSLPLQGLRVLELARVLAGPWAGQILADLGAEVVKVERERAGDDTRAWGPPFVGSNERGDHTAAYFYAANRGKRSIEVDFETEKGRAIVRDLARQSDVLIENFKVGGLAKFALDHKTLSAENPQLIYCSITGFGQDGPYAHRAGYDLMAQGLGGLMDITGAPDGMPTRIGVPIADILTGLYSVIGILAALVKRDKTGTGAHIDTALLDSTVGILSNQALNYLASGKVPRRAGNAHPNVAPYQVFPVSDGHIIIAAGNDGQFRKLCALLGRRDLEQSPKFTSNAGRMENRSELIALLQAETERRSAFDLLAQLEAAGIPAGPINTIAQVFDDPQVKHREMRVSLESVLPDRSGLGVRTPIIIDGAKMVAARPAPKLGEHTNEILAELRASSGSTPD